MKVAIFSAAGIGDGLIMMAASHAYQKMGFDVTSFNNHLGSFGPWFEGFRFEKRPPPHLLKKAFASFDLIVVQHENSVEAKLLAELEEEGKEVILFYNNYRRGKHPPLKRGHFPFDEKKTMLENVSLSIQSLLSLETPSKEIGMSIPAHLTYRKYPKRVVIHPMSSWMAKNWTPSKFIRLGKKLLKKGYQVSFSTSPKERPLWKRVEKEGIELPPLQSCADLAALIYESGYFLGNDSGPGHLASYLQIPSLIVAGKTVMSHWQPGWRKALLVLPPPWAPNMKGPLRLRENKWQWFVSVRRVYDQFLNKIDTI